MTEPTARDLEVADIWLRKECGPSWVTPMRHASLAALLAREREPLREMLKEAEHSMQELNVALITLRDGGYGDRVTRGEIADNILLRSATLLARITAALKDQP